MLTGVALLVISVALSPDAWRQFLGHPCVARALPLSGLLPIPYEAGPLTPAKSSPWSRHVPQPRIGEPLLIIAIVVALPTLWMAALSTLVALVPILRGHGIAERARREPPAL